MVRAFEPCFAADLTGDVHDGDPGAHVVVDALYLPDGHHGATRDAALYDRAGGLIVSAAGPDDLVPPRLPWGASGIRPLDMGSLPRMRPEPGKLIFGGVVTRHYDQFLTGCLSTLWYYSKYARPADRVVFLSKLTAAKIFGIPWMARLLAAAGVREDAVIVPESGCVFDELVVPGQVLRDDAIVFSEFGAYARNIGRFLGRHAFEGPAYWLSKTGRLPIEGEDVLETWLSEHGVEILDLKNLDIDRQVSLFRSGAVIAGFIGPAFLTSIFCETGQIIAFSPDPHTPRLFDLFEAVSAGNTSHLRLSHLEPVMAKAALNRMMRITDVAALGEAIVEAIAQKASGPITRAIPTPRIPAPSSHQVFRAYSIASSEFGRLHIDMASGHLYAQENAQGHSSEVHLLASGAFTFLVAAANDKPAIVIFEDGHASPVVSYLAEFQPNGELALKSPVSGLYLSIQPGGAAAIARAEIPHEWEFFNVVEQPDFLTQHAGLVRSLERALHSASAPDPVIRYATQRLFERQPAA